MSTNKENVDSTGPPSQFDNGTSASGQLGLGKRKHEEPSSRRVANEQRPRRVRIYEKSEVWQNRCEEYHREYVDKGTTQAEFAKTHGLAYSTFRRFWIKYREENGLVRTTVTSNSRSAIALSQGEGNGNTNDMKTNATTQNTRNRDQDSDGRQTKPQEPPSLPPPLPAGTVRGNPRPIEARASIPPAASVAIKTEELDDRPVKSTYRYFLVASDDDVGSQRLVRLQETCNDTYTFHDLRHAIRDQLSSFRWGKSVSFQFTLGQILIDPRQETWNVREFLMVDSGADGSFRKPYQVTIKVLDSHQPQADMVGSNVDV